MNIPIDNSRLCPATVCFASEKQYSGFKADEISATNNPNICLAPCSYTDLCIYTLKWKGVTHVFLMSHKSFHFPTNLRKLYIAGKQFNTRPLIFSAVLSIGWATLLNWKISWLFLLLLSVQYPAISVFETHFFAISLLKKIFFCLSLSTRVVGEDDFLSRAIFDQLHFSPSQSSGFLTTLGGKRHVPQQIAFVCQQLGKFLFLGKLVPVYYNWMASPGQSFPNCGLQSPEDRERVQRGLWSVRKNSAGQQLLTFSWLEEWGCGFTRLSLQHQFWLLVFPFQPFPTACFIFPPAVHGPLASPGGLVCGSAVKRIRNLIQFGGRHTKNEVFPCQAIFKLDLFPAPAHCTDAPPAAPVPQRDTGRDRAALALPWAGCSGKTTATRAALIAGGQRLCSLGKDELLFSALIAGSSSVPPEERSERLSLKPKLQWSLTLLWPCGAADSGGCMKTDVSRRGHLFQVFGNAGLGIPRGFCLWLFMTNLAPSDGEQYLRQKLGDFRRTLSCGEDSHSSATCHCL